MLLILSTSKTVNASYRDATTGSVLYKVKTPVRVHDLTTTITRRIDNVPRHSEPGAQDADERFGFLARIAWRLVGWRTTIQFGGREIDPATYFRAERTAWLDWRAPRSFLAFVARSYSVRQGVHFHCAGWQRVPVERAVKLLEGARTSLAATRKPGADLRLQLKVNDAAATLVAEYRVKSVGLRTPKSDAMLEIFPEFEHLADEIMACISGPFLFFPPDLSLDDFYPCRKDTEITSGRK